MYRLTLYYLGGLIGVSVLFSAIGILSYNPLDILIETGVALIVCGIANWFFAKLFHAVTSTESVFITALILVLIIPVKFPHNVAFFIAASVIAMAVKYLATVEKRHIFNPAAAAVAAIALLSNEHSATWWVGTPWMLPFVLLGGLLVVRKLKHEAMVYTFFALYFSSISVASILHGGGLPGLLTIWQVSILQSSLFFFGFVMFTEPLTTPSTKRMQLRYAGLVAILFSTPQLRLFSIGFTPELALCFGNIFSFIVSPKYRFALPLNWIQDFSTIKVYGFKKPKGFTFKPGQYMEWTLPHKNTDNRGNRRYFSIASSPTEDDILLMVKHYTPSSSYKNELASMNASKEIIATSLSGDFTLPSDISKSMVCIAGGVGVAPFRSMIAYIVDKKIHCDLTLVYVNSTVQEIAFPDLFKRASDYGVKTIYALTNRELIPDGWQGEIGYITKDMIERIVPEYKKRLFYLSGPQLMVQSIDSMLISMGVLPNDIKEDFFPGYSETS